MRMEAKEFPSMSRWRAAGIHLGVSLLVACCVGVLLYFLWFPSPYFAAAGASALMLLLMGVDIGIGPLLTLIVFNPRKRMRAIRLDLWVIGILQVMAFSYGAYVIFQARPVFVVAEVDRLVLVAAEDISPEDMAQAALPDARSISLTGPRLVGTKPPAGPDGFDIIATAMEGGKDISQLPQYYLPYAEAAFGLLERARPLAQLKGLEGRQQRYLKKLQTNAESQRYGLLFLPLERGDKFFTAIIRDDSAEPVAVFNLDPWDSGSISE